MPGRTHLKRTSRIEIKTEATIVLLKLSISNPLISLSVIQRKKALITIRNRPRVTKTIGKEPAMRIHRKKYLSRPYTLATPTAVLNPRTCTVGISRATTKTERLYASTSIAVLVTPSPRIDAR